MFSVILFSAVGGACLMWGVSMRAQAKQQYWRMMSEAAAKGTQSEDLPYIEARLSSSRFNANAAIFVGLLLAFGWLF